ncbi:hypothetical protein C8J57DRAFT_1508392 [Mycena rebaudengoi]|nr:hypothetical protein C8J57DRAFT_1508392 [Mycena rebaudengoi]
MPPRTTAAAPPSLRKTRSGAQATDSAKTKVHHTKPKPLKGMTLANTVAASSMDANGMDARPAPDPNPTTPDPLATNPAAQDHTVTPPRGLSSPPTPSDTVPDPVPTTPGPAPTMPDPTPQGLTITHPPILAPPITPAHETLTGIAAYGSEPEDDINDDGEDDTLYKEILAGGVGEPPVATLRSPTALNGRGATFIPQTCPPHTTPTMPTMDTVAPTMDTTHAAHALGTAAHAPAITMPATAMPILSKVYQQWKLAREVAQKQTATPTNPTPTPATTSTAAGVATPPTDVTPVPTSSLVTTTATPPANPTPTPVSTTNTALRADHHHCNAPMPTPAGSAVTTTAAESAGTGATMLPVNVMPPVAAITTPITPAVTVTTPATIAAPPTVTTPPATGAIAPPPLPICPIEASPSPTGSVPTPNVASFVLTPNIASSALTPNVTSAAPPPETPVEPTPNPAGITPNPAGVVPPPPPVTQAIHNVGPRASTWQSRHGKALQQPPAKLRKKQLVLKEKRQEKRDVFATELAKLEEEFTRKAEHLSNQYNILLHEVEMSMRHATKFKGRRHQPNLYNVKLWAKAEEVNSDKAPGEKLLRQELAMLIAEDDATSPLTGEGIAELMERFTASGIQKSTRTRKSNADAAKDVTYICDRIIDEVCAMEHLERRTSTHIICVVRRSRHTNTLIPQCLGTTCLLNFVPHVLNMASHELAQSLDRWGQAQGNSKDEHAYLMAGDHVERKARLVKIIKDALVKVSGDPAATISYTDFEKKTRLVYDVDLIGWPIDTIPFVANIEQSEPLKRIIRM